MQSLTTKVSQRFLDEGNTTKIDIAPVSTDVAAKRFCEKRLDLIDISRELTDDEGKQCAGAGIDYRRIHIANDAIVVVANPKLGLSCMRTQTLKSWWAPSADGALTDWSQLGNWPADLTMDLYGPGPGSGTYEVFSQLVEGSESEIRHDFTVAPTESVAIAGVEKYKGAAGFVSYPTYDRASSKVAAVAIDDAHECVVPTLKSVQDKSYLLSRPLYLYVSSASWKQHAATRAFVRYYVDNARLLAEDLHYVPLTSQEAAQARRSIKSPN
jgi:phosphate transport system substrate-binding protein